MKPFGIYIRSAPDINTLCIVESCKLCSHTVLANCVLGHVAGPKAKLQVMMQDHFIHATSIISNDNAMDVLLAAAVLCLIEANPYVVCVRLKAIINWLA